MKFDDIKEFYSDDKNKILCAVCGSEFTHLRDATLIDGEDQYRARPEFRQDIASVKMSCENDHLFKIIIGEHKGNCFICTEI